MQVSSSQMHFATAHQRSVEERQSLTIERFGRSDPPGRPVDHNARVQTPARPPGADKRVDHPHHVDSESDSETSLSPQLQLLKTIVEALTGRLLELFDPEALTSPSSSMDLPELGNPTPPPRAGTGARITTESEHTEHESLRFEASGQIQTSDGQEIHFRLSLNMERSLIERSSSQVSWGEVPELKDPLVINFDGAGAQLSADRYQFDIDADGELDLIAGLAPGRAFLVLDRNQNGLIDDGSEVIGALSGEAFEELAAMDEDGNGFVDAGDPAFDTLATWRPGDTELRSLTEANIGALATSSLATPMQLDTDSQAAGQLRRTSIYLTASGEVGTTQQIDLLT